MQSHLCVRQFLQDPCVWNRCGCTLSSSSNKSGSALYFQTRAPRRKPSDCVLTVSTLTSFLRDGDFPRWRALLVQLLGDDFKRVSGEGHERLDLPLNPFAVVVNRLKMSDDHRTGNIWLRSKNTDGDQTTEKHRRLKESTRRTWPCFHDLFFEHDTEEGSGVDMKPCCDQDVT